MKRKWNCTSAAAAAAALGVVALALRLCLYLTGVDEKGLLKPFHPCTIALWLVCALVLATVLAAVRTMDKAKPLLFPASPMAAVGTCAVGAVLLVTALTGGRSNLLLDKVRILLGIASGLGLIPAALFRWQGKKPHFLLYALVGVCFAVRAISRYQSWCGDPQLQNYFFDMMAILMLMLFSYQLTAFCVGLGNCRILVASGMLAAFCALAALPHSGDLLIMGGGMVWTLTEIYSLVPVCTEKE